MSFIIGCPGIFFAGDMATDVQEKITAPEIAQAWAQITIKVWRQKLVKQKAVKSNVLWQSFLHNVIAKADGDLVKIEFAFLYYGRFVDMGVGRGSKFDDVKSNRSSRSLVGKMLGNRRRPKKWYSKTFAAETKRLSEIMARHFADKGVAIIRENIDSIIKIG